MSSEELDAFRSELLRQKIIFEAELRRQREAFEERLLSVTQELAAREADCRNLQSVITILGKKVDALSEQAARRPATPRRMPTPTRPGSVIGDDDLIQPPANLGGNSARGRPQPSSAAASPSMRGYGNGGGSNTFIRRPSPLISVGAQTPATVTVMHRVSSLNALSRTSSPARNLIPSNSTTAATSGGGYAAGNGNSSPHEEEAAAREVNGAGTRSGERGGGPTAPHGRSNGHSAAASPIHVTGGGGSHPHRNALRRRGSNTASDAGSSSDRFADPRTLSGGRTPLSKASPRGRRRSNSLKGKLRTGSVHRLQDMKASDDW